MFVNLSQKNIINLSRGVCCSTFFNVEFPNELFQADVCLTEMVSNYWFICCSVKSQGETVRSSLNLTWPSEYKEENPY